MIHWHTKNSAGIKGQCPNWLSSISDAHWLKKVLQRCCSCFTYRRGYCEWRLTDLAASKQKVTAVRENSPIQFWQRLWVYVRKKAKFKLFSRVWSVALRAPSVFPSLCKHWRGLMPLGKKNNNINVWKPEERADIFCSFHIKENKVKWFLFYRYESWSKDTIWLEVQEEFLS